MIFFNKNASVFCLKRKEERYYLNFLYTYHLSSFQMLMLGKLYYVIWGEPRLFVKTGKVNIDPMRTI